MEGVPNSTGAAAHVPAPPTSLQEDSAQEPQDAAKKGRFSRKKEKKKAKKAKKASKHSKDRDESEGGGGERNTVEEEPGETGEGEGRLRDSSLRTGHRSAFTPYQRQVVDPGADHQGQDGTDASLGNCALHAEGGDGPADRSHQPTQGDNSQASTKPRSRSASRKKLPSLFRRRGRSQGGEDRGTSQTDMRGGAGERSDSGVKDGVPQDKKSRKTRSLDRGAKPRHSPPLVDPHSMRQSASLERDAYRRFDPTKQPRDRLQHMTVKDAVLEYRHRHQPPPRHLTTQAGDARAASDTDLSQPSVGAATGPQQSATLPRGSAMQETSLLGEQGEARDLEGFPRHNLGQQIKDMCTTPLGGRTVTDEVDGAAASGARDKESSGMVRNTSSVIFINPSDIEGQGAGSIRGSVDDVLQPQPLKPSHNFLQLRKAPLASSTARRASQAGSSASGDGQAHNKASSPSSVSASSKGDSSLLPATTNIPGSEQGANQAIDSTSEFKYKATSPEITVNCVQSEERPEGEAGVKMDSSVTMDTSMISSTDSGKRSSDQGFFSEPRESDTDSEVDMSGFSTPPEELYSERDSARNSLSPTVFVNNVSNLLEVPRAKGVYKRSVSDGVRKPDSTDTSRPTSAFARTQSLNNNSVFTKAKAKQPSSEVSREGKVPQDGHRGLKKLDDNVASADKMDQKTVPVMGTSVQQKYRRTFSPVRSKEAEGGREENAGPAPSSLSVPRDVTQLPQPTPVKPRQPTPVKPHQLTPVTPDEPLTMKSDQPANDAAIAIASNDSKDRPRLQRGRGSGKKPGYVSGRSFRRKRDVENKAPDTEAKNATAVTSPPVEVIDDGAEELKYRIAFQDKSIQTSDSLLNELIKKSKKRKLKPFSSGGKKSKNEQPRAVTELAADVPPPRYEEERPRKQEDVSEVTAEDGAAQPVVPPGDGEGLGRQGDEVPEITPLLPDTETPADAQGLDSTQSSSKKASSKPRGTSFRAIVALKRKLTRNRKKDKQANEGKAEEEVEDEENRDKDKNKDKEKDKNKKKEKNKNKDKNKDKDREVTDLDLPSDTFITIENELNLSKLAEIKETDILDDDLEFIEAAFSPVLPPKKDLRFEPSIPDEPVQSEEPLPPLSPASRRMTARRNSTRGRERRKKCLHCCKKFIAFLFSHIGLCSLVVGYTIFGGFIFQMLEGDHDREVRADVEQERRLVMNKIKSLAHEYQLDSEKNLGFLMDSLELVLKDYQKKLYTEITDNGWDGNENDPSGQSQSEQWSFASALLYAITVMTTIGYGHVAPKTSYGRVVTIFYAVLGIPLTLLCLTNIGDVMASGFRLLYGKVCCGLCCKLFKPSRRRRRRLPDVEKGLARQVVTTEEGEPDKPKEVIQVPTSLCLLLIATYIFAGSLLFSLWEDWDFLTGSYFCFITLSTIGFGDIVPGMDVQSWSKEYKLVLSALYLIFGLSLIAMCFNLVQEDVKAKCRWLGMKIGIIDKPEPPV